MWSLPASSLLSLKREQLVVANLFQDKTPTLPLFRQPFSCLVNPQRFQLPHKTYLPFGGLHSQIFDKLLRHLTSASEGGEKTASKEEGGAELPDAAANTIAGEGKCHSCTKRVPFAEAKQLGWGGGSNIQAREGGLSIEDEGRREHHSTGARQSLQLLKEYINYPRKQPS